MSGKSRGKVFMNYVLSVVGSSQNSPVSEDILNAASDILVNQGLTHDGEFEWLKQGVAADISFNDEASFEQLLKVREFLHPKKIDFFFVSTKNRKKRLVLADMDSTIVPTETIVEIANAAGVGKEIDEITNNTMNDKSIDFCESLRMRVKKLKGVTLEELEETRDATRYNTGAYSLIQTMKKNGAKSALVSGGFTFFTEKVLKDIGFDFHHSNTLGIENGVLNGEVTGPIIDGTAKRQALLKHCEEMGIETDMVLAMGDGSNDIAMLSEAGLGIGYKPKQAVADEISNVLMFGDFTSVLYAQGYREDEIISI